eukprot:CAMPEP_0117671210 /NCGR_PEP_ID=MMETSP0804-20121206/13201_1 /TAXON_ID=1074897 /ORGANISM="Tetraselmis astigmatica, Strain CCMP880" /LENGTH=37 /DNA_ID= /DNA_START= /DNA_END= /DNA_ORIENTATION=
MGPNWCRLLDGMAHQVASIFRDAGAKEEVAMEMPQFE